MCSLHLLGISTIITCAGLDQSIAVGVVCDTYSRYACTRMMSCFAVDFKNSNTWPLDCDTVPLIVPMEHKNGVTFALRSLTPPFDVAFIKKAK